MVNYPSAGLDRTFAALADPTRRALLARLGAAPSLTVSELARPFPVSLPAIMKHISVLSAAGLVARRKAGRTVTCTLNPAPMEEAAAWLERHRRFWSEGLDRLADFLEEEECPTPLSATPAAPASPPAPASPSRAASARRRPRSTPRGRSPKG
jgi:DNA-binding transcriptional ArsR family regulator